MLPQLCRFLSNLRCDNRMQLRIARNEQDGALNACNDLAPWSSVSNRCECRLQDVDIQLSFGVSPGDDFLFGPVGIQGEAPGDALLAWECSEIEEPLPPVLLLLLPTCLKRLRTRSCFRQVGSNKSSTGGNGIAAEMAPIECPHTQGFSKPNARMT